MKYEQETIGNLMQYQQLGKFYNLYFKRKYKEDYVLYEDETIMEGFIGESGYYGLVSEEDMKLLENIIERIESKAKKELTNYAKELINKINQIKIKQIHIHYPKDSVKILPHITPKPYRILCFN